MAGRLAAAVVDDIERRPVWPHVVSSRDVGVRPRPQRDSYFELRPDGFDYVGLPVKIRRFHQVNQLAASAPGVRSQLALFAIDLALYGCIG